MLGLRPRLKARNSLWDLVNKHSLDLHSSSSISWKQPVEEGADGLPPIQFPSSSFLSEGKPHNNHSPESSASFIMAPVSSATSIAIASRSPANWAMAVKERLKEVTRGDWRRAIWCARNETQCSAYMNWVLLIAGSYRIHLFCLRVWCQRNATRVYVLICLDRSSLLKT